MQLLLFGCGYLGRRIADLWRSACGRVAVATRNTLKYNELEQSNLGPIFLDPNEPFQLPEAIAGDRDLRVVVSIGYERPSGRVDAPADPIEIVYPRCMRHILDALPDSTRCIIDISSTGVYSRSSEGDRLRLSGDDPITENSPCQPTRPGGLASLLAERELQSHHLADRGVILRLAGIYGPGRLPRLAALQAGEPIDADPDGLLNLIHADDAAAIAVRAAQMAQEDRSRLRGESHSTPEIFNVSDGHPVRREEFYRYAAELAGWPAPRFLASNLRQTAGAERGAGKRIANERVAAAFNYRLQYPTYREGLAALMNDLRS